MSLYIHQLSTWPEFEWDQNALATLLAKVRYMQGRLLGRMETLGFKLRIEATLQILTQDVLKSSEIEGEILNPDQVRSSIARRLGMEIAGSVPSDRDVDGVVEMMLNATQRYHEKLTDDRLFDWHTSLFPSERSSLYKIVVGSWRNNKPDDPMQVVSGASGREKIHYQAPDSNLLAKEMEAFLDWFNASQDIDPVLKAAIAHLWFITIHPFDDGNGRIARAITDMQLARADESSHRFYSMSSQIRAERNVYYESLEYTQKGSTDITLWLRWFLECFGRALSATDQIINKVLQKASFWENSAHTAFNSRQNLMLNKLLDGFDGKLTSSKWAKIAKCSQDTATRDIQDLTERNILLKEAAGGRSTSYIINVSSVVKS